MDHFSGTELTHPLRQMAAAVSEQLKEVEDLDPVFMTPDDQAAALRELDQLEDRLRLLRYGVVRAAGELAAGASCRSVADWRVAHHRRDGATARREDRLAEALGERWTATAGAVRSGRMSMEQAEVAARALDGLVDALEQERAESASDGDGTPDDEVDDEVTRAWVADVVARAEAHLVAVAPDHTPAQLRRLADHLLTVVTPDHAEELERRALERAERRAREKARLTLKKLGDGTTRISGLLPEAAAHVLTTQLDSLTAPRVTRPTATDTAPVVDPWIDPSTGRRVPAEHRRGQAFVALLERISARQLPQHGGLGASVVVTIDLESLRDGTGHGTIGDPDGNGVDVSVGQVRRLACASGIIPAVLGSGSVVLDLGRTSRLFSMGQRKAHAVTHKTCEAEGCSVPAEWCESHHKRDPWAAGGTTDLADLSFLCPWHHHRAHDPRHRVSWSPSGGARFHRRR